MAARIVYGYGLSGITALKLDAPINEEFVDPTTIESFKTAIGNIEVYTKAKDFHNTFVNYQIANVDIYENYKNVFYVNSGSTESALTTANSYYICNGGNWLSKYNKVRYPYPIDLEQKIENGFPIKFSFIQYDKNENGFWNSLYSTMSRIEINDAYWAANLFSGSNVPRMNLTFNPTVSTTDGLNVIETTNAILDGCFEGCSNLKSVILTRKDDEKTFDNLKKVFKDCVSLSSITFNAIDYEGNLSNAKWNVGQLESTFKNCSSMNSWPSNIVISDNQFDEEYANDNVVYMSNAFEGSGFQTIGSSEEFKVGSAKEAFKNSSAVTINATLDLVYLHPEIIGDSANTEHVENIFDSHQIETIELKNVNHNSWSFDGESRNGFYHIGDCTSFNQNSVEYLFNNLYDLTSNAIYENILKRKPTIPKFNNWTIEGGTEIIDDTTVNFTQTDGILTISNVENDFFKFNVSNLLEGEQLTVIGGNDNLIITQNGNYYVDITASSCTIIANNVLSNIVLSYITTWSGDVDTVTNASLFCPAEWDNAEHERVISDGMVTIATNRGWMVYVDNELHSVRVEVVLEKNSLSVGETTNAKVYFVRTRGEYETRTEITNQSGITYYSTNSEIASVDANGEVTGNGDGTAYIYVNYNGLISSIYDENAKEEVNSVEYWQLVLSPNESTLSENNPIQQFTATYNHYVNGTLSDSEDVTSAATWSVNGVASAYTSMIEGLVTRIDNPTNSVYGTIDASYNGINAHNNPIITVEHSIVITYRIELTLDNNTIYYAETTNCHVDLIEMHDGVDYGSPIDVTDSSTYSSNDDSIATVDNNAIVTGINGGTTYINAQYVYNESTYNDSKEITVNNIVTYSIDISSPSAIEAGETGQCTGYYVTIINEHETSRIDVTSAATWESNDNSILIIGTNTGIITGQTTGITTVNCTYENTSGSSNDITITDVSLVRIEVEITDAPKMPASGGTINSASTGVVYIITAIYANGDEIDITNDNNVIKSGNTVTASSLGTGVTSEEIPCSPNLSIEAEYEGLYSSAETTIYQEINSASTPTIFSSWTVSSATTYSITCQSEISNLNQTGGTQSNPVYGNSQTPWNEITRYETSYTSGDKSYNDTITSAWTVTNDESVFVTNYPEWIYNIITGTTGSFDYEQNDGGDRSGYTEYELTNSPTTTGSTKINQKGNYDIIISGDTWIENIPASGSEYEIYVTGINQGWGCYGWPDWITVTPTTGNSGEETNVIIEIAENTNKIERSIYIYFTGDTYGVESIYLSQNAAPVLVTGITVTINDNFIDIPFVGAGEEKSITYADIESAITVTGYFDDGSSRDLVNNYYNHEYTLDSNTLDFHNRGKITGDTISGILEVTATTTIENVGITGSAYCTIVQEANYMSASTEYGSWYEDLVESASTTATTYSIVVENETINNLPYSSGNVNNDVYGTSTAITTDVYLSARTITYTSAWTSGVEQIDNETEYGQERTVTGETINNDEPVQVRSGYDTDFITGITIHKTDGKIYYSENDNSNSRTTTIVYELTNDTETSGSTELTQEGKPVTLVSIAVEIDENSVPIIPASGGSVTCNDITYTVTAYYSDSSSGDVTAYTTIYCTGVTGDNLNTNITEETEIGTLTISAEYEGKTDTDSVGIKQEANNVTSGWTEEEEFNISQSSWTVYDSTSYTIEVSPSAQTVSSGSGSFDVSVNASATTPYATYSAETYQIATTSWSAYTSTASANTGTISGETVYERYSGETDSGNNVISASTEYDTSSWNGWISGSTPNINKQSTIRYSKNTGNERTGNVTYKVNADPTTTASCEVTQAGFVIQTRTVTIIPNSQSLRIFHDGGDSGAYSFEITNSTLSDITTDVSGSITYTCDPVSIDVQNVYTGTGAIVFSNVTTSAFSVILEISYADFPSTGDLIGTMGNFNGIDCTVTAGSAPYGNNVYLTRIDIPSGQIDTTKELDDYGFPTMTFSA